MKVTIHNQLQAFLAVALPALRQDEAANNLMLGIALALAKSTRTYSEEEVRMASVEREGRLAAVALMTPPYNLLLHCAGEDCTTAWPGLAAALLEAGWPVPGVTARVETAAPFAQAWGAATGMEIVPSMQMRAFKLEQVVAPDWAPGRLRPAGELDVPLLLDWYTAFVREAVPHDPLPTEQRVRTRMENGEMYLWVDAVPVSMAATARPVGQGITIGAVYTPPEQRRRGYASALVAALSQHLLDAGYAYCTLFTDLANPTSNAIYQRVGYRPVCDYAVLRFEQRP